MHHLTFPDISHRSRYLEMIEEWKSFETSTSPGALFHGDTYEEFLENRKQDTISNRLGIPATLFFFMDDEEILGALHLRHHIDHPKCSLEGGCGGHIGYGLRPSARGKGLAKEMLRLGLIEAQKIAIDIVLLSAHEDNPASWKTIEHLGGKYIKSIDDEGKSLKVYRISIIKKPSRKEKSEKVRAEKAKERIARKQAFRKKTEKKLVEKSQRKVAHKKANAQRKFQEKLEKKKIIIKK